MRWFAASRWSISIPKPRTAAPPIATNPKFRWRPASAAISGAERKIFRVRTPLQHRRGLRQNGPLRGEKAKTYVNISRLLDEAMGHFGQIPSGRPNGFHLEPKAAWKGNQPSRRTFRSDLFAIWAPRRCCKGVRTLSLFSSRRGGSRDTGES